MSLSSLKYFIFRLNNARESQLIEELGIPETNSYCCLGIAYLAYCRFNQVDLDKRNFTKAYPPDEVLEDMLLDTSIKLWVEPMELEEIEKIEREDSYVGSLSKVYQYLVYLNDTKRYSFTEIAGWLETHIHNYIKNLTDI